MSTIESINSIDTVEFLFKYFPELKKLMDNGDIYRGTRLSNTKICKLLGKKYNKNYNYTKLLIDRIKEKLKGEL